jgi:hypothetical protein
VGINFLLSRGSNAGDGRRVSCQYFRSGVREKPPFWIVLEVEESEVGKNDQECRRCSESV